MSRLFRVQIDEEGLIDGLFAYVTEPRAAARNAMPIVREFQEGASMLFPWELAETMVLDGVDQRRDVAALVHFYAERLHGLLGDAPGD
jgi:hypothetical protein